MNERPEQTDRSESAAVNETGDPKDDRDKNQNLTPEQEHFLAMQERARVLACRTGSCG